MNRRIRKKKEKLSILNNSYEIAPEYKKKSRKRCVNKIWNMYHKAGIKILIGYKYKGEYKS